MAAQAWKIYNRAKYHLGNKALDLNTDVFRLALVTSASNFATLTLSTWGQITGEVASAGGYASSGYTLSAPTWGTGTSAKQYKFDSTAWGPYTATGAAIDNIKGAVIFLSAASAAAAKLLAYASLTSTEFDLAQGNTITITPAATGVFTLV